MSANPMTVVSNFPDAARLTGAARHEMKEASGEEPGGEAKNGFDPDGHVWVFGRGRTDVNITYLGLYNASGVLHYIYPNAAGNGIIVTPTEP